MQRNKSTFKTELNTEELLAEIARLKKELKKKKKYGLVWEEKVEDVVEMCKEKLPVLVEDKSKAINEAGDDEPMNILIEGDNYHALSALNYTHEGKIDVIYIDPPYNTGAKNWMYNNCYVDKDDAFRHSKWISFMSPRLILAKKLLKKNGALICAIDDNEHAHLKVLLDEIYYNFENHSLTIIHNPKGVQGNNFSYTHEYALFVIPKNKKTILQRKLDKSEIYISNLRNWGGESFRSDAKNCFYPIIVKNQTIIGFGNVAPDNYHPKSSNELQKNGCVFIWPIDNKGVERKWRYARQSVQDIVNDLKIKKTKKELQIVIAKEYGTYKTVWIDKKYDASEYATKLLKSILPKCDFDFPKSLWTIYDCIFAIIGNRKESFIMDFFAGSGTTGQALLEINNKDGGKRKFILVTNNENNICTKVCYPRIKKVIKGYKNIKGEKVKGLGGNLRYFKTDFVESKQTDRNKKLIIAKATDMLCIKEDTYDEVKTRNKHFKIFRYGKKYTGIIYDYMEIDAF